MPSSLKAVFESLAPGNPYCVCLYCAPIRRLATINVGRRNFDDRWRDGTKTRKADTDVIHYCSQMKRRCPPLRELRSRLRVGGWMFGTTKFRLRYLNSILVEAACAVDGAEPRAMARPSWFRDPSKKT